MTAPTEAGAAWVNLNQMTQCYDTRDGTRVAVEVFDDVTCLADIVRIAAIRKSQRERQKCAATGAQP